MTEPPQTSLAPSRVGPTPPQPPALPRTIPTCPYAMPRAQYVCSHPAVTTVRRRNVTTAAVTTAQPSPGPAGPVPAAGPGRHARIPGPRLESAGSLGVEDGQP